MEFTYCDVWKFYRCDLCPYRTTSLLTITSHVRQHRTSSIPAPFTCDLTVARVSYKCEICGFETPLKVNLSNHVNIIHKQLRVKYDYVDILRNFACGSCEFQSHSFLLLTKHAWNCATKDELVVLMRSQKRMTKCKLCYFVTHDESLMRKHKRSLHPKVLGKDTKPTRERTKLTREHTKPIVYYQIPIEQLKNMQVIHRNAFMNNYRNDRNSVRYQNSTYVAQNATSIINGHDGNQSSEILLIPLKQSNKTSVKQDGTPRKRKQHKRVCQTPIQQGATSGSNCEQHPEVYPTPVQHRDNFCVTQGDNHDSTNREQHPEIVGPTPIQHPTQSDTPSNCQQHRVQHLDSACATQSEDPVTTNPEQHPTQVHLNNTCGTQVEAQASTNREQHLEVHPLPANQTDTPNASPQRKKKIGNASSVDCLADISDTYQCKYCSFNTQFRILINYHEKVRHKNRKVKWDLIGIFQDFHCPCCSFETASQLVLLKHTVDKHFTVCECCHLSHPINVLK